MLKLWRSLSCSALVGNSSWMRLNDLHIERAWVLFNYHAFYAKKLLGMQ